MSGFENWGVTWVLKVQQTKARSTGFEDIIPGILHYTTVLLKRYQAAEVWLPGRRLTPKIDILYNT